jgi:cytochrome c5
LGAPKFGDKAAWTPRIATGYPALLLSALKGKNAMPPQGGGEYDDVEVARALVYMANAGGANFAEPPLPKPAASSPAATASK